MAAYGDSVRKASELAHLLENVYSTQGIQLGPGMALALVKEFATITAPEDSGTLGLVIMRTAGRGGGRSAKPGNIAFDMPKLIKALSAGVLTTVAAFHTPWTAVFGAIILWDRLYAGACIDLSENEASVLWTMWQLRDEEGTVAHDGLLGSVNVERQKYGRTELSARELDDALGKLEEIATIERFSKYKSRWWLREWVRVKYQ
jgi:hypothetical protein